MRGSSVKNACPRLNEAEGSQRVGPEPGNQVTVAFGFSNRAHSLNELVGVILSVFINWICSLRRAAIKLQVRAEIAVKRDVGRKLADRDVVR